MTTAATAKPGLFPMRKKSGTADFHLTSAAVDFGSENLEALTPRDAVELLAKLRWGSAKVMPCPHCGTQDSHYFYSRERRWKCKGCGSKFSVTSGTVFADHKLSLVKILKIVFAWANGASGKPALQLRRDWNVAYATAFSLCHKLREGLSRGFNQGVLCGVTEMDGMDINGRRSHEKRNKPQGGGSKAKPAIPAHLAKPTVDPETGEILGPPLPPKWGKAAKQPADRRLLLVLRQRGQSKGKGASATRVAIAISESAKTVVKMATRFASAESRMHTDEDPAYALFSKLFAAHQTITHSREFSDRKGNNNNQAESFNWRMRRAAEGVYLNISNKYLSDYAAEQAWREDTRRMSNGNKLHNLLSHVLNVGQSLWWRGYTHGVHRNEEFLVEGPQPARKSGRAPGAMERVPR